MNRLFTVLTRLLCSALLMVAVTAGYAAAPTGKITGHVTDPSGNALPGASIHVKGTTRGVVTDLSGNYTLFDLKPGSYTLEVTYMGLEPAEATVEVTADKTVTKNFSLEMKKEGMESVIVTGIQEGQQKALNQQRNADNIKQVISADLMGRYPDLNVAESLQRLPGVTIDRNKGEGSTIQLRGTPAGFTNINVNGEQIMSSGVDGERNAPLDMMSVNVLSSMEVVKTLTPDLDGDAIAGVVNLKTPTATSLHPRITADAGLGYNNMRQKTNMIGNLSYGQRFFANENNQNGRLGIVVNGSYYRTDNGYDDIRSQVWDTKDFGDGKGDVFFPTDIRYVYYDTKRTRQALSATIDYQFSPSTSLVGNVMYNDLHDVTLRYRKRTRMKANSSLYMENDSFYTAKGKAYNEVRDEDERNSNRTYSLEGTTALGNVKFDAGVFYTETKFKSIATAYNFITGNIDMGIKNIGTDFMEVDGSDWKNDVSLYTYNIVEGDDAGVKGNNFVSRFNMTIPYTIGQYASVFKAGVKTKRMHNERYRPDTYAVYNFSGDEDAGNLSNFTGVKDVSSDFVNGNIDFGVGVDHDKTVNYFKEHKDTDFTLDESSTRVSTDSYYYDAVESVVAGYIMNKVQINKLMVLGGLRVERTKVDYRGNIVELDEDEAWASTNPIQSSNSYTKFLPNLQFKYDLDANSLIRAALTFSYSRPTFTDLVPGRLINILGETVTDGNPALKPAFSTNVDLMYEKYLKNLGILSGGVFYKSIQDFQYNSVTQLDGTEFDGASKYAGYQYYRTLNGNTAKVFGVELNAQANLTFLPGILKGFTLMANYTYTTSDADAQERKDIHLPGQALNSANGSLAFTYKGFTIQGNLNYNGSYTKALGADDATDIIRDDRVQLDANANYRMNKRWTLYAQALNLTNAPRRDYFGDPSRMYQVQYYSFWGRVGVKFSM